VFSDFMSGTVNTVDADGRVEVVATVERDPVRTGLIAGHVGAKRRRKRDLTDRVDARRKIVRVDGSTYADLSTFAPNECNAWLSPRTAPRTSDSRLRLPCRRAAVATVLMRVAVDGTVSSSPTS